jgi:hypothetical protein
LIDDRIDRNRGLADLTVADDEFALALTDRNQRIDRADTRLQRLFDRLTLDDARRRVLDRAELRVGYRAFAVDGVAERIDDASQESRADGDRRDAARAPDLHALFDLGVGPEDDDADAILFEIERDALEAVGELDELRLLHGLEPVDAGDTRPDLDDGADLIFVNVALEVRDLALQDSGDFVCVDHFVLS